MENDIKILQDFVAIPNDLAECQRQLIESRDYIDAAFKAVSQHRRHEIVSTDIAKKCPHLAKMLNEDLRRTVGVDG